MIQTKIMAAHNGKRLEQANINDQNKTNKQTNRES